MEKHQIKNNMNRQLKNQNNIIYTENLIRRIFNIKKEKIYILIIIILIIIISILTIIINKQKERQNTNEATQDIVQEENGNSINRIIEEPKEYVKTLQSGIKKNESNNIKTEKTVQGLIIKNISLTSDGNNTTFSADVKNINKYNQQLKLKITLLKEDGTEWMTFNGIVSKTDDETLGKINTKISNSDFTNAYDVKIEID